MSLPADVPKAFETDDASIDPRSEALLPIEPNWRFVLMHYPENWEIGMVDGVAWWLPGLHHLYLVPGVNSVETPQRGQAYETSYSGALTLQRRRKVIDIPFDVVVPVEDEEGNVEHVSGYLRSKKCRGPRTKKEGVFYLTPWETPRPRRLKKRQKFDIDKNARNRWRLGLVRAGIVKPPASGIVDDKLARRVIHEDREAGKVVLGADVRERLQREAAEKTAAMKDAKLPGATKRAAPAKKAAWETMARLDLIKAIAAGQADLILDDIAADTRSTVAAAVAARREALKPEASK